MPSQERNDEQCECMRSDGSDVCGTAHHTRDYVCTRAINHIGKHVACNIARHRVVV